MERTYYHLAMAIGGQTRENLDVVIRRQLITEGVRGQYLMMDEQTRDIQYRINLVLNPYVDISTYGFKTRLMRY